jgi:hypothetical protein
LVRRSGQSPVHDVTGHLEINEIPFHRSRVSKVEQMETELRKLSPAELRQIREWLDEMIEDELEFTPEFERSIEQAERDMACGKSARIRKPEGS